MNINIGRNLHYRLVDPYCKFIKGWYMYTEGAEIYHKFLNRRVPVGFSHSISSPALEPLWIYMNEY